jgi:hypothetical protein
VIRHEHGLFPITITSFLQPRSGITNTAFIHYPFAFILFAFPLTPNVSPLTASYSLSFCHLSFSSSAITPTRILSILPSLCQSILVAEKKF